jgi:AraC family transcriptional regulator
MGSGHIQSPIRACSGAIATRVVSGPSEDPAHHHEWPVLSIHVVGEMTKLSDEGATIISSPCAVLHAAGASHANIVGEQGWEQIDIVFDPAWLRQNSNLSFVGVPCWIGGATALAGRRLARLWCSETSGEDDLRRATREFLQCAANAAPRRRPRWLSEVLDTIKQRPELTARHLASLAGCSPEWLTQAFRVVTGEGLREASARIRIEKASVLLRTTSRPAAEIALEAGFCDQSHMSRCFKAVLGRTPSQVRSEADRLRSERG